MNYISRIFLILTFITKHNPREVLESFTSAKFDPRKVALKLSSAKINQRKKSDKISKNENG